MRVFLISAAFSINRFFLKLTGKPVTFGLNNSTLSVERLNNSSCNYLLRQYKCQVNFTYSAIIFFILIPFLFIFLFIPVGLLILSRASRKNYDLAVANSPVVAACLPSSKIIPNEIILNYGFDNIRFLGSFPKFKWLGLYDVWLMYCIMFRFFFYPLFYLKCVYNFYRYSCVTKLSPSLVLVSNEYSFCSSAITWYFNQHDIKVANCMHGEKASCLRDCFTTYNYFYVWDAYFRDLFLEEMFATADFIVDSCKAIELDYDDNGANHTMIVYFLQGIESEADCFRIKHVLQALSDKYGSEFYLKQHPSYVNKFAYKIFDSTCFIEGDLADIVSQAYLVASAYSTVLFQAFLARKKRSSALPLIFINDLLRLPQDYHMIDKADFLFSKIIIV